MAIHKNLPVDDSHFAHAFEYADLSARTSASGFVNSDIGKLARQIDNNTVWMLTATTPTWIEITGGGTAVEEIETASSAPSDISKYWVDTNTTPYTFKYWNGSIWEPVAADVSGSGTDEIETNTTPPVDTSKYWVDTNITPFTLKYWDGSSWVTVAADVVSGSTVDEIEKGVSAPSDTGKYWIDTNTTPYTFKYYNGSSWVAVAAEGTGGGGASGINEIDIRPNAMRLDDVSTGSDKGVIWNIIDCVDFNNNVDGSIWFSFKLPSGWNDTTDIDFVLEYSCDGNDQGKSIIVNTQVWVLDLGDTPNLSSPDATNVDTIGTSSSNINSMSELQLSNGKVPNAVLTTSTNTIVVKLTRDADNGSDNYTGTFQLMSILASQV